MNSIGEDADLLVRSDEWLEQQRKATAADLDGHARELEKLLLAQQIKRILRDKNAVAVQKILQNSDGEVEDITLQLMNLPDALCHIEDPLNDLDSVNAESQVVTWSNDGYDVETSRSLRS